MAASTRWLVIVAGVTAALVAVSLVVVLLADREAELDRGTPEGVVQAYLRAVADGDANAALELYAPELQDRCELSNVRDSLRFGPEGFRATLDGVEERGDTTEVRVDITQTYGEGPFGRSESTFEQVFILEQVDGEWRFVEPPWPTWCPVPATPTGSVPAGRGEASPWA